MSAAARHVAATSSANRLGSLRDAIAPASWGGQCEPILDLQFCSRSQAENHLGEDQSKDMGHAFEINDLRPKSQRIRRNLRFEESHLSRHPGFFHQLAEKTHLSASRETAATARHGKVRKIACTFDHPYSAG
jgi:hypothetical protein